MLSKQASAGVGVGNCGPNYVTYEPYKQIDFNYIVLRPQVFTVSVAGDLSQYYNYNVEGNSITGSLTLPPDFTTPGTHLNFIRVTEVPSSGGTAVGVASVNCPVYIVVPFPGKYLSFDFHASSINTGEAMPAGFDIISKGDQNIYDAKVTINIVKAGKVYLTDVESIPLISPSQKISKDLMLKTQSLQPGLYDVNAYLQYGNKTINSSTGTRVGSLDVNVLNITKTVKPEPYTKINFTVENNWNNPVNNVYVTYEITSASQKFKEVQTPSVDLKPFGKETIESIAETPGLVPGSYFITYQVHFEDNVKKGTAPLIVEASGTSYATLILILSGIMLTIMMILLFILIKRSSRNARKVERMENRMGIRLEGEEKKIISQSAPKTPKIPGKKKNNNKSNKKR